MRSLYVPVKPSFRTSKSTRLSVAEEAHLQLGLLSRLQLTVHYQVAP